MNNIKFPISYFTEYWFNSLGSYTWSFINDDKIIFKGVGKCPDSFKHEKIEYTKGKKMYSMSNEQNDYFIFYETI